MPTLVAAVWSAATLLVAVHGLAIWLIAARPLSAWAAVVVGAIILLVMDVGLLLGILRIRPHCADLRGSARPVGPTHLPRAHAAAELAADRLGLPATPPVYVLPVEQTDSFTIGWGRPELFISEGLAEELDDLALRAALAHEMAHVRGRHVLLATLALLPLRARLVNPLLLVPFAIMAGALRGWARVAELSADRGAAIAVGGAEPVAHWLSAAVEKSEEAGDSDLHHYLTFGADELDRGMAEAELRVTHPAVGRRIIEVARFARSRRFANCLAIVGDLRIPPATHVPDPSFAGVAPFLAIGVLAAVWLAPLTIAITVALGAPGPVSPLPTAVVPVESFDPNAAPEPVPAEEPTEVPVVPEVTVADDVAGLLEVARMHREHDNLSAARQVLEELLLRDPTVAEAHYLLAWVHVDNGDRDLAAAEFTATVNLTEPDTEMHEEAADALDRLGY